MSLFKNNLFRRIKDAAVSGLAALFGVGSGPPVSGSTFSGQVANTIGNVFGSTAGTLAQIGASVFQSGNVSSALQPIALPKSAVFLDQPGINLRVPGAPAFGGVGFPTTPTGPTVLGAGPATAVGAPPRPVLTNPPSIIANPPLEARTGQTGRVIQGTGIGTAAGFGTGSINSPGVSNMSLVSSAIKLAQRIPQILRGPAAQTVAGGALGGVIAQTVSTLPQVFGGGASAGACPAGWHLNKQNSPKGPAGSYCVRNRRMNVLNGRAARRSVRRIKGAMKQLKTIEGMMPSKRTRARAPVRHITGPAHTS